MRFKYNPHYLRKRRRLRKSNPYHSGSYSGRPAYLPQQTLHVYHRPPPAERDRMLPSGYTVGQTWGALHKSWLGYCISLDKDEGEKRLYYASIIQKLQKELGIQVREFAEVDMFGSVIDNEDDDSKYALIDLWTNEKIEEAKEDDYVEVDLDGNRVNKSQDKEDNYYL